MDVLCRGCGGRYHEATEHFDAQKPAHGAMFRLKDKYRAFGWSSFPEHAGTGVGDLECPECGAPYCAGTRVQIAGGEAQDERIKELHASGMKPGQIARELGLGHHASVFNRLKKMGLL